MTVNNKFTIMFIKPDAVRDGLIDQIVGDFLEAGLIPVFSKPMELTWDQAMIIYRDHMDNPNYEFAVRSLIEEEDCKESLFLFLKNENGDTLAKAQETKGRADKNGVRAKYRRYLWSELKEKGIEGDELKTMLSRNRVHVPDSDDHVCEIIGLLLSESELREIMEANPELIELLEGCRRSGIESDGGHGDRERI